MKVVIVGAGFGGLETATCLSEALGDKVDVTLIDRSDSFVFGFSKLDVMFGRATPEAVHLPYRAISKAGVTFRQEEVTSIDPVARRVVTNRATYDADILVVALGADYDVAATPGLAEGGHEFYSVAGATRLRDILPAFEGGTVVVGVMTPHYKCPPAPSETAMLMHDYLTSRGLRDRSRIILVTPFPSPLPVSKAAGDGVLARFAELGIECVSGATVTRSRRWHAHAPSRGRRPDSVRPVARSARPRRPEGGTGVRAGRERLDPGRSGHLADSLSRGLRYR